MTLVIFSKTGTERLTLPLSDNCLYHDSIGGDCYIGLSATLFEGVVLAQGDYADYEGQRFWLIEDYSPRQEGEQKWTYEFNMYGTQSVLKGALMLNAIGSPLFALTAPAADHVRLVVSNVNRWLGAEVWQVGEVIATKPLVIDYSTGVYANDAMSKIAEAADTEWWADGTSLHVGKCLRGEPLRLGYGAGLVSLEQSTATGVKFFSRLFPIGSSRNIDPDTYGDTRLHLPGGARYVERNTDRGLVEHFEADAFADIYPRRIGKVSAVRHIEVKDSDGKPYAIFYFSDAELPFNPNDYAIGGLVKHVIFQTGNLAGFDFEANYDAKKGEYELITQWPYSDDTQLPNAILSPQVGDEYALYNIRLPEEYYRLAERELAAAVETYMDTHCLDLSVYKGTTDYLELIRRGERLIIGRRVRLESTKYFPTTGFRESRITSIFAKMSRPTEADIEISEVISRTSQSQLKEDVKALSTEFSAQKATLPPIVRSWETTPPTDANLYTARAVDRKYLRKDIPDVARGRIGFADGLQLGDNFVPGLTGVGGLLDKDGNGELRNLRLWESLEVPELRYNRVSIYTGIRWDTFGGGIIERAEAGRAYLKLEEGEVGAIGEGDLCMGIWHDHTGNETETTDDRRGRFTFAGFKTVYFRVDSIPAVDDEGNDNSDRHYFTYILREGTTAHPFAQMHFAGRGNVTDPDRQAFTYTTTEYSLMLSGVNSWEFTEANYKRISGKLDGFSLGGKTFSGHGDILCDAHIYGSIEQFTNAPARIEFDTSHGLELLPGEQTTIRPYLLRGYNDASAEVTAWALTAEGGESIAYDDGFTVSYDNLSAAASFTLFTLRATTAAGSVQRSLAVRRLRNGQDAVLFTVYIEQGSQFYRDGQDHIATLRAVVTQGDTDITATYHPSQLVWTRESAGDDDAWNAAHVSATTSLRITTADMAGETAVVATLYNADGTKAAAQRISIN